ncbi:spore coat protein coth, partial [Cunninghamella echinulata]
LHTPGKSKNPAKQSWKWELPSGSVLNGRTFFKIRHMEEDPTQLREKLYADILRAMGTYGNEANMIRFFINGEGMGTFNMLDDIPNYSYIRAMFYQGGNLPSNLGGLFDGTSGVTFEDTSSNYNNFVPAPGSSNDQALLKKVCKDLAALSPKNDDAVTKFSNELDVDQFLRFMVMEYLAADWDGYWQEQTNIGVYEDLDNNKVYFLGQDFDATFGVNIAQGREFVTWSYKDYPKKFPKGILMNTLLQNDNIKSTFENYLTTTVTSLFNNNTLTRHILAYHDFILPDLEWDRSIKQQSPGINYGWTYSQVTENLWHRVSAPNHNGGGADWGLIEWINARSQTVAKEFGLAI